MSKKIKISLKSSHIGVQSALVDYIVKTYDVEYDGCNGYRVFGDRFIPHSECCYASEDTYFYQYAERYNMPCWTACPHSVSPKTALKHLLEELPNHEISLLNNIIDNANETDDPLETIHKVISKTTRKPIIQTDTSEKDQAVFKSIINNAVEPPTLLANLTYSNNDPVYLCKLADDKYFIYTDDSEFVQYDVIGVEDYLEGTTEESPKPYYYHDIVTDIYNNLPDDYVSTMDNDDPMHELFWLDNPDEILYFKTKEEAIECFNKHFKQCK